MSIYPSTGIPYYEDFHLNDDQGNLQKVDFIRVGPSYSYKNLVRIDKYIKWDTDILC